MTDGTTDASTPLAPISEDECWELLRSAGIGRISYTGRFGPMIQPINFEVQDKSIYFRVAEHGPTGEDLRTGIAHADYRIAFQADEFDTASRSGWSVLVQGDVHPMETEDERASVARICVESWVSGPRELFLRITPTHLSGHRIGQPA
jgi:nitroimidazol reductase NimA-like FMN-containing flavoprotein (pyridoxamine 5'-phosphate oxidase superfamily)